MTVAIDDLDPAVVSQTEAFLTTFLQEAYPSMDLTAGRVLHELVIRPAALFYTLNQTNIDQLRQSMSMKAIEENPALATPEVVDAVLSNYRITRDPGTKASGFVSLVITDLLTTAVPAGTIFTAEGLNFLTETAYIGVTDAASVVSSQERLITKRQDGAYVFTVPVTAQDVGDQYNIKANTRFTVAPTIAGLVDAAASADFAPGTAAETNQQLVDQFKEALSPYVLSGRAQINSLIREILPLYKQSSIIGFGDEEMLRDRHNIFEISQGGKADIYVRTEILPQEIVLTKEAVLISPEDNLWQLSLGRDDAPGFYVITGILPADAAENQGSLEMTEEVRGLDLTPPEVSAFVPDVADLIEGAYTRYQTAVVKFVDPAVGTETTRQYKVKVLRLASIATLQDDFNQRSRRNPQADYLVRAPIPAFMGVALTIHYTDDDEAPVASAVKQAIAQRVNAVNFSAGQISASLIHDAAHSVLTGPNIQVVSPIDMECLLRKPAGEMLLLRSADALVIPDLPQEGVTARTTSFFLDESGIDVTIEKVSRDEV